MDFLTRDINWIQIGDTLLSPPCIKTIKHRTTWILRFSKTMCGCEKMPSEADYIGVGPRNSFICYSTALQIAGFYCNLLMDGDCSLQSIAIEDRAINIIRPTNDDNLCVFCFVATNVISIAA